MINQSEEVQQNMDLLKKLIFIFQHGCQYKKCLSPDCKNFIEKNPALEQIWDKTKESFLYVVKQLESSNLKIYCLEIDLEQSQQIDNKFYLNFISLFNMDYQQQQQTLWEYQNKLQSIELIEDTQLKQNTLALVDLCLQTQLKMLGNLLQQKLSNFELTQFVVNVIENLRVLFVIDNFLEQKSLQQFLQELELQNLLKEKDQDLLAEIEFDWIVFEKIIYEIYSSIQCIEILKEGIINLTTVEISQIKALLNTVKFVHQINHFQHGVKQIEKSIFVNDEILTDDFVEYEVVRHYNRDAKRNNKKEYFWIPKKISIPLEFSFFDYSFLFSVARKIDLLKIENQQKQEIELNKAVRQMFTGFNFQDPYGALYLELKLNRDNILQDSMHQLLQKSQSNSLLKPLKIVFNGEQGMDQGGLTKEFFQLLTQQLFDPCYGMFIIKNEWFIWFNLDSFDNNLNFELVGMMLGLALYNQTILKLDFPIAVYKMLIKYKREKIDNKQMDFQLEDIWEIEPQIYTSLVNLRDNELKGDSGLSFVVNYYSWDQIMEKELLPNGVDIPVTELNKHLFIQKYLYWIVEESIKNQFEYFAKGFFRVCKGLLFDIFEPEDLHMAICGRISLNFEDLKKTTIYDTGYNIEDKTIQDFWTLIETEFSEENKRDFLKFLTGSDRSPVRGLQEIKMVITKHGNTELLPASHTCFNNLVLPDYQDYEMLKKKLILAIQHNEGFGMI